MEVRNFLAGTFEKYIDTVQLLMMTVEYFFFYLFIYFMDGHNRGLLSVGRRGEGGWGRLQRERDAKKNQKQERFMQRELKKLTGQVLTLPFKRAAAFCRLTITLIQYTDTNTEEKKVEKK